MKEENEMEEEELTRTREDATHWRNAYWARVREQEQWDGAKDPDNFGGSFRGVRTPGRHGSQSVHPEDTLGQMELCWCGLPLDHMWPGRTVGTKHPNEETMKTLTAHVDRRDLRAYHRTIQDFLLQCINTDQLRFRISKNSVILYPPDGTQPQTVYARNSERQLKHLAKWYIEHVEQDSKDEAEQNGAATTEQIERLAKRKNDPDEHPPPKKKAHEGQVRDVEDVELPATEDPAEAVAPTEPQAVEEPVEKQELPAEPGEWTPRMIRPKGRTSEQHPSPNIEQRIEDGVLWFRCRPCEDTDHPFRTNKARSIGGHQRIYHTDSTDLYSPEARAKAVQTRREREGWAKVEQAAALLNEVLGTHADPKMVEVMEARIQELVDENEALRAEKGELEARIALMREAFQGL